MAQVPRPLLVVFIYCGLLPLPAAASKAEDGNKLGTYAASGYDIDKGMRSGSRTIHVPADAATLQAAIELATDGDAVIVASGTYKGPGNRDIDFLGKAITVRSETGDPADCVVDCQGLETDPHRGFVFRTGESLHSTLQGFTIRNGYAVVRGGGILCDATTGSKVSPTIQNCIVEACVNGGGLAVVGQGASPALVDCVFRGNNGPGAEWADGSGMSLRCIFIENTAEGALASSYADSLAFTKCEFLANDSHGFAWSSESGAAILVECTAMRNGGHGLVAASGESGVVKARGCTVSENGNGGIIGLYEWVRLEAENCEVQNNREDGIAFCWPFGQIVQGCSILNNGGFGIRLTYTAGVNQPSPLNEANEQIRITDSVIGRNAGGGIGGGCAIFSLVIEECVIHDNLGDGVDLRQSYVSYANPKVNIINTTIASNVGRGVVLDQLSQMTVTSSIIYGQGMASLELTEVDTMSLSCNDIYGNAGGDWAGDLSRYLDVEGNIQADPYFCNVAMQDYHLFSCSPCLDVAGGCDQIGALGLRCEAAPVIMHVTDISDDQGGRVRLAWRRSDFDGDGNSHVITGYGVYRRQDDGYTTPEPGSIWRELGPQNQQSLRLLGWDFLTSVPARGDEAYQYVAETLRDSTAAAGLWWSVFFVSAMTADPLVYFDSQPDSGYSVDNLAPEAPPYFAVRFGGDKNILSWATVPDEDLAGFKVYRGLEPNFEIDPSNPWFETNQTGCVDTNGGFHIWYKIAAIDLSGNESEPVLPLVVTDVALEQRPEPLDLSVGGPNPFNSATTLVFYLSTPSKVSLRVYDLTGRLVRTLIDGQALERGRHQFVWNARDDNGRLSASGNYYCLLSTGNIIRSICLALVK